MRYSKSKGSNYPQAIDKLSNLQVAFGDSKVVMNSLQTAKVELLRSWLKAEEKTLPLPGLTATPTTKISALAPNYREPQAVYYGLTQQEYDLITMYKDKIGAIKEVRLRNPGWGLKEAKDYVESAMQQLFGRTNY